MLLLLALPQCLTSTHLAGSSPKVLLGGIKTTVRRELAKKDV